MSTQSCPKYLAKLTTKFSRSTSAHLQTSIMERKESSLPWVKTVTWLQLWPWPRHYLTFKTGFKLSDFYQNCRKGQRKRKSFANTFTFCTELTTSKSLVSVITATLTFISLAVLFMVIPTTITTNWRLEIYLGSRFKKIKKDKSPLLWRPLKLSSPSIPWNFLKSLSLLEMAPTKKSKMIYCIWTPRISEFKSKS